MVRSCIVVAGLVVGFAATATGGDPRPVAPSRGDALVELGRRLFFDPAVSRSGDNSCASCHEPDHGFSSADRLNDDDFLATHRHSQTLIDSGDGRRFHWDGEFDSVAALVTARLGEPSGTRGLFSRPTGSGGGGYGGSSTTKATKRPNDPFPSTTDSSKTSADPESTPVTTPTDPAATPPPGATATATSSTESAPSRSTALHARTGGAVGGVGLVAKRIGEDGRYAEAFRAAYGADNVTTARLADAIEAFVASIRSTTSPFDRHVAGEAGALDAAARRGLGLFRGRAGCAQCHRITTGRSPFTDREFHNTGIAARAADAALTAKEIADRRTRADQGRAFDTSNPSDRGAFKTPTLRDVALRPPYMHDGSFATLEEVVRYYAKGAHATEGLDSAIRPFDVTSGDVADLVAFLRSLTGETRPGRAPETTTRVDKTTLRVLDQAGHPLAGLHLSLASAGDRLPGAPFEAPAPVDAWTDDEGVLSFEPTRRTHVVVALPDGLRAPQGGWIPDTCGSLSWRLPVVGRSSLLVVWPTGSTIPARLGGDHAGHSFPAVVKDLLLKAAERLFFTSRTRVVSWSLVGSTVVGGKTVARYASWVAPDAPEKVSVVFTTPAGRREQEVAFGRGVDARVDLTAGVTER